MVFATLVWGLDGDDPAGFDEGRRFGRIKSWRGFRKKNPAGRVLMIKTRPQPSWFGGALDVHGHARRLGAEH